MGCGPVSPSLTLSPLLSPPQPAVCTRELCVFSFYTLGVMSGAAEEVATGAEVGLGTVVTPPAPWGVVPSLPALPQGGGPAGGHVPRCPRVPSQEHHLRALSLRGGPQRPQNSGLQPQGKHWEDNVSSHQGGTPKTPLMSTPLLPRVQKKNYERLQKALDSVMSIREMTQVCGVAPQPHSPM